MKNIAILTLLLASQAFGNTSTKAISVNSKVTATETQEKNSKQMRAQMRYSLQYGYGATLGELASTYELNYIKSGRTSYSVRYSKSLEQDLDDTKQDAFLIGMKRFTGNSFFVRPELYYRKVTETVVPELFSSATAIREYQDIGLNLSIGNEWQWDDFTAGFDWIGLGGRIAKISDNNKRDWLYSNNYDRIEATVLTIRIGYSF